MFFFFNLCDGTLGTAATTSLLYQPRMIGEGDCEEIWWKEDWQEKPKYSEKTCPSATLFTIDALRTL
jgi:DNA-binding transcriptional regulator/RsmH inhibitor MraZ